MFSSNCPSLTNTFMAWKGRLPNVILRSTISSSSGIRPFLFPDSDCACVYVFGCVYAGKPHNPMVNAGAILLASLVKVPGNFSEYSVVQLSPIQLVRHVLVAGSIQVHFAHSCTAVVI